MKPISGQTSISYLPVVDYWSMTFHSEYKYKYKLYQAMV